MSNKNKELTSDKILDIISKLSTINDGVSGECGNFAVALNRIILKLFGVSGSYVVMHDQIESMDRFYHVLLKVGKTMYDAEGIQTKKDVLLQYGSDENDSHLEFGLHELEPNQEYMVLSSRTDAGNEQTVQSVVSTYFNKYNQEPV